MLIVLHKTIYRMRSIRPRMVHTLLSMFDAIIIIIFIMVKSAKNTIVYITSVFNSRLFIYIPLLSNELPVGTNIVDRLNMWNNDENIRGMSTTNWNTFNSVVRNIPSIRLYFWFFSLFFAPLFEISQASDEVKY